MLNPNLAAVRRSYDPVTGVSSFAFDCLIDLIYWQLADALAAGDLRQCPCGQLFFAEGRATTRFPAVTAEARIGLRFRTRKWLTKPD